MGDFVNLRSSARLRFNMGSKNGGVAQSGAWSVDIASRTSTTACKVFLPILHRYNTRIEGRDTPSFHSYDDSNFIKHD